ncbi:hypothetical protein PAMP_012640 [Pampus punctatissimus]
MFLRLCAAAGTSSVTLPVLHSSGGSGTRLFPAPSVISVINRSGGGAGLSLDLLLR